jgi:hypothetical protein
MTIQTHHVNPTLQLPVSLGTCGQHFPRQVTEIMLKNYNQIGVKLNKNGINTATN